MNLDIQMFAVPARRVSKTRKNSRRANYKKAMPTVIKCSSCGEVTIPHRACSNCGFYKGKEVIAQENEE